MVNPIQHPQAQTDRMDHNTTGSSNTGAVIATDGAQTVITTNIAPLQQSRSVGRWLKHACSLRSSRRTLTHEQSAQLAAAIAAAEQGHCGELQVIIEGQMPAAVAWRSTTRQRALQLFAQYRVWDTQHNSGVLIYLNLCDRQVELVADRGIDGAVPDAVWQQMCHAMQAEFAQQRFATGLINAVEQVGELMRQFYQQHTKQPVADQNELANTPILI